MNEQVKGRIEEIFLTSQYHHLPESHGGGPFYSKPVTGVAHGDDHIFEAFKDEGIIGPEHMTPAEVWAANGLKNERGLAKRLRVLSIVFPYIDRIREESKDITDMPAETYCLARNHANEFIKDVLKQTIEFFRGQGYRATAGMTSPAFRGVNIEDPNHAYSTWSERHIAFAAGLGTFSLHEGLITEVGCNVRLGSVITDAPLEVTPRKSDDPYANCLYYAKGTCKECIERCPGNAITEKGHDKIKCIAYRIVVRTVMTKRLGSALKPPFHSYEGMKQAVVGCAFCQFNVPCMDKNPMAATQMENQAGGN